jgi:Iron-sulfur cluster-binding domain
MAKTLELPRYGWLPDIRYVQVQTHSRCNADCVFCPYVESEHAAEPGKMTDETWHLILANLRPFSAGINTGKFCPYLMQEPLIDRTIFDKIKDIYRCFPGTCVEVSTNGAALTDKVVDQMLERMRSRRHSIWVSHHGIDAATFEHVMKIDHARSTANLVNLLKKSNGRYVIKIRGAGESHDDKHVYFTRQQYLEYWTKMTKDHQLNMANVTVDAFRFHDRAGTLHREDRGANLLNMGTQRRIDPEHPFHCPRIDQWIHFMWDGKIRLCCMDYHGEVDLPNVNEVSLLEYFHGQRYYDLVEQVSGRKACKPSFICARCTSPGG